VKSALPLILLAALLFAMFLFTRRNRERAAAQQAKFRERIAFGTDVMTTSGLYGTVVGVNGDDSVQLSIAPGVEVKWAIAALRDIESLPTRYRGGAEPEEKQPENAEDPPDDSPPR
jgi:preprotein translocase subunit YajC